MKNSTISNISYSIVVVQSTSVNTHTYTFDQLFNNKIEEGYDWEFVYALDMITEDILKLSKGDSLYFKSNRDEESKGIIVRIS